MKSEPLGHKMHPIYQILLKTQTTFAFLYSSGLHLSGLETSPEVSFANYWFADMPSVLVLKHLNFCFFKKTLICVLHPMRLLHAVWPDLQTLFLIPKSPSIPSGFVYISQTALGNLPRKALAKPTATAVGIYSQAIYKQNDNGNRNPKL